jgi:hypothetical protein
MISATEKDRKSGQGPSTGHFLNIFQKNGFSFIFSFLT